MSQPLFATTLVRADHTRSFEIRLARPAGWNVAEREDQQVLRQEHYTDWHRVEHTRASFSREITELREQGWREA